MLKQVFDKEQLSKILTSSDVWQWDLLSVYGNVETAIDNIVQYWKSHNITLSSFEPRTVKNKSVFIPSKVEDAFAIKLLDRFVRRIYKVRQSDRNRIVRQLKILLKDSGNYHVLRLDIKNCYESIPFKSLINKFEDDMILAPECINLLNNIYDNIQINHDINGLPRGLSISPTLAELYLESLDKKISIHQDIIYNARFVDDIIIFAPSDKIRSVKKDVEYFINENDLYVNDDPLKYYCDYSCSADFDYLGYSIKVEPKNNNPNKVNLKISQSKLNKLKSRIAISFCDHKRQNNIGLLKRRLEYLFMLKRVRNGKNGDLLAGLAHNYQYVTDGFECLKPLDGFLCQQLTNPRFGLNQQEQDRIKKISIYGSARNRTVGKFTKKKTVQIMRVWKNA
jgi:hypothetical protein